MKHKQYRHNRKIVWQLRSKAEVSDNTIISIINFDVFLFNGKALKVCSYKSFNWHNLTCVLE